MRLKYLFLLFLLTLSVHSAELLKKFDAGHAVTDMLFRDGVLFVSTEQGEVRLINFRNGKLIETIKLPSIRDFMGNPIPPKVYSIDISPSGKRMLIVSEASGGFSEVYLYEKGRGLEKLIDLGKNMIIKKGRFYNDNLAVFGLLGDEIALFDVDAKRFIYVVQVGTSSLSDINLSDDKNKVAVSDEGGVVTLVSVKDGKVLKRFKGVNVDKLYELDYRDEKILVGGRDRRVALYYTDTGRYRRFPSRFLVFSVAMDESAKLGAYLYNEENDVRIIELDTGRELDLLKGHEYPVSVILFLDGVVITGCDDGKIFVWRYKR
ncbi:periplasmic protein [Hydrogenivirga sp. 128-5-R1-1]|uniref:WD40 repeat domain-containing protein n=1 Tax=Hydrogenivirga sp. 128-5-R1-1 TaxID=392423 RepID=UPI00015F0A58|nr:periplasmic protein [Hydrogenivirga sp. 128-5-R1-1]EDP74442.1 putative periplasmic protein [Hydrogenivirga sp. 128-5-R1-1]